MARIRKTAPAPVTAPHPALGVPGGADSSEQHSTRHQRRLTAKVQEQVNDAEAKKNKIQQKWTTAVIRSTQALEEINDFANLGPESEQEDFDEDEPAGDQALTFRPVSVQQSGNLKVLANQGNMHPLSPAADFVSYVKTTLTRRVGHIPKTTHIFPTARKERNTAMMTPPSIPRRTVVQQRTPIVRKPTPYPDLYQHKDFEELTSEDVAIDPALQAPEAIFHPGMALAGRPASHHVHHGLVPPPMSTSTTSTPRMASPALGLQPQ
ncbi:hypothetical protein BJ138DRAFT_1118408 [Hygrophoropsis aurantiaca]|uniref:Uncharacterized protein n=1 Tax=Hygrophoropsis aurantiaca TaxID=72124 RepID=A0ACB7ZWP6_9AGAM|nr:hypothetical protein BJ138DRAFT_1118408 [Hygrophoropsis aurantiaca]